MATQFEYVKIGDGTTQWSALPYVAGFPGATGVQGPTGPQGTPGVSGGLVLFLDTAGGTVSSVGNPISGTLNTSANTSAQTTITTSTQGEDLQLGSFTVTTPSTLIVSGIWDLNLFAAATITAGQYVYLWFEVGSTLSDGSGYSQIATGSNSAGYDSITSATQTQYVISMYLPTTTLGATDKLRVTVWGRLYGAGSSATLCFRDSTISHLHTTILANIPSGPSGPSGVSGVSGPSGVSGVSGPSGVSGVSGPSGPSGAVGPVATSISTSSVTGTSLTAGTSPAISTSTYGTYYYITNSGFNSLTLPTTTAGSTVGSYWVLRNNTSTYLSVTVTNNANLSNPLVIPPSNSTTIVVTTASSSPAYVLF